MGQDMRAIRIKAPDNLKNIKIILNEPQEPGNIGSTARVMKGMGFDRLILINPVPDWREHDQPWAFACWSHDILHNAVEYKNLDEAILAEGIHMLVGTTHRRREKRLPEIIPLREGARIIAEASQEHTVAIMFGREDFGLSTEDISRCNLCISIPMARRNPSFNLSHAVAVIAYEVLMASLEDVPKPKYKLATLDHLKVLEDKIVNVLKLIGFRPTNEDWSSLILSIRRAINRPGFEKRDVSTLLLIFSHIERYLTAGKVDPAPGL